VRLSRIQAEMQDEYRYTLILSGAEMMDMHQLLESHEMEIVQAAENSGLVSDQLWALTMIVRRLEKAGKVIG